MYGYALVFDQGNHFIAGPFFEKEEDYNPDTIKRELDRYTEALDVACLKTLNTKEPIQVNYRADMGTRVGVWAVVEKGDQFHVTGPFFSVGAVLTTDEVPNGYLSTGVIEEENGWENTPIVEPKNLYTQFINSPYRLLAHYQVDPSTAEELFTNRDNDFVFGLVITGKGFVGTGITMEAMCNMVDTSCDISIDADDQQGMTMALTALGGTLVEHYPLYVEHPSKLADTMIPWMQALVPGDVVPGIHIVGINTDLGSVDLSSFIK